MTTAPDQPCDEIAAAYAAHAGRIQRYLARHVHDADVAADLTSLVFEEALRAWPTYEDRGYPVTSWLYAIARSRVIDWLRRQRRRPVVPLDGVPLAAADDDLARVDAIMLAAPLWEAPELTDAQRQVLILRFREDLALEEVARRMGLTVSAVKGLQARGLARLRQRLAVLE
jgi:RNA polymerase sigma-70 factor (ECF subfamily)